MGLECDLTWLVDFQYNAQFDNGLSENEYDRFYVGKTNVTPNKRITIFYSQTALIQNKSVSLRLQSKSND